MHLHHPDPQLAYLDFGLLTEVGPADREAFLAAVVHLVNANYAGLVGDFAKLGLLKPTVDRGALEADLRRELGGRARSPQAGRLGLALPNVLWRPTPDGPEEGQADDGHRLHRALPVRRL